MATKAKKNKPVSTVEVPQGGGDNAALTAEQPVAKPVPQKTKKQPAPQKSCFNWRNFFLLVFALLIACGIAALCFFKSIDYSDDENKFSDYFPYNWPFEEKGVLMAEPSETRSIQVATLDACTKFCEELGTSEAGNYFDLIGVSPGDRTKNCFCMNSFMCVADMSEQDKLYAPAGTAFSKTRREKSPTCDQSYCAFSSANCA